MWYQSRVFHGDKEGRKLGYPTANLDPIILTEPLKFGVYSSEVKYNNKKYKGALFYGPRLIMNETKPVLEIYILDFNEEIYDEIIEFKVLNFIREVMNFKSVEDLIKQIEKDIQKIRKTVTCS